MMITMNAYKLVRTACLVLFATSLVLSTGCDNGNEIVESGPLTAEQEAEQEKMKEVFQIERGASP